MNFLIQVETLGLYGDTLLIKENPVSRVKEALSSLSELGIAPSFVDSTDKTMSFYIVAVDIDQDLINPSDKDSIEKLIDSFSSYISFISFIDVDPVKYARGSITPAKFG